MYLSESFAKKNCLLSYEVFPPQKTFNASAIHRTVSSLSNLRPDFISVTCGAGGSSALESVTIKIAHHIKEVCGVESLAHLTCVNSSRQDIEETLAFLKENHIDNVLALRGDRGKDATTTDFSYASELISLIQHRGGFHIAAACYPEVHPESLSRKDDIEHLKKKVDAGAAHLVSQLFFNNDDFYSFLDCTHAAGITVPIMAGIMPVVNKNQIGRIVSLCGASLPAKFSRMMVRFENDPDALRDAGIVYATEQIVDLISSGVRGIHIYTMNNPAVAEKITRNIEGLLKSINNECP